MAVLASAGRYIRQVLGLSHRDGHTGIRFPVPHAHAAFDVGVVIGCPVHHLGVRAFSRVMGVLCTRCKAPAEVSSPDPRCIPCFTTYLHKTFKTSIGRLGAGGRPTSLALGLSGGHTSTALALLFAHYLSTLNPNPHAQPSRIVILNVTEGETPSIIQTVRENLPNAQIETVQLPAGSAAAINVVKDVTDRAALARTYIQRALIMAAREHGCDKLLLGTCATRAAVDVLHAAVTGHGTAVRDVAASRVVYGTLQVIRPLRDIQIRQLVRYVRLEMPNAEFVDDPQGGRIGLYDIVQRFIGEAGEDNAASVHNVVRTAEKLLPVHGRPCEICSAAVSDCKPCDECDCGKPILCLGCQDCVDRAGDDTVMKVIECSRIEEKRRTGREEMRKAIEDFLL